MTSESFRIFYPVLPLKQVAPAINIFSLFMLAIIFIFRAPNEEIFTVRGIVLLSLTLVSDVVIYLLRARARLEITPLGIVYVEDGFSITSTWDNLVGYGQRRHGLNTEQVLFLRRPGLEVRNRLLAGRLENYEFRIPVGRFSDDWRNSELGGLIRQYAPQAIDNPI